MPRSVKIHPDRKQEVLSALERNGFLTQGDFAVHLGIALSTVSNFINSKKVYVSKFEQICETLGLDRREIVKPIGAILPEKAVVIPKHFSQCDSSWVGRDKLITNLSQRLHNSCRFLLILGLTGIGKTALAERLAIELQDVIEGDWDKKLLRANFDYDEQATDFAMAMYNNTGIIKT